MKATATDMATVETMAAGAETGETAETGEAEATGAPQAGTGRSAASAVQWDGAPASFASKPADRTEPSHGVRRSKSGRHSKYDGAESRFYRPTAHSAARRRVDDPFPGRGLYEFANTVESLS